MQELLTHYSPQIRASKFKFLDASFKNIFYEFEPSHKKNTKVNQSHVYIDSILYVTSSSCCVFLCYIFHQLACCHISLKH